VVLHLLTNREDLVCMRTRRSIGCTGCSGSRPATHTGTAPLEASSGQVVRHRLSRAGDRKLNHALHLVAIVQVRHPNRRPGVLPAQARRRQGAQEALRCLKRRLSDAVCRCLLADQRGRPVTIS
jgi:transposase